MVLPSGARYVGHEPLQYEHILRASPQRLLTDTAQTVLTVAAALLFAVAVLVLLLAVTRAWREGRKSKVIIRIIDDATGNPRASAAALGLTYRLREELLEALPSLVERSKQLVEEIKSDVTNPIHDLIIADIDHNILLDDIASSQRQLAESINTLIPDSARSPVRVITETLLRPQGLLVSGAFQRISDAPGAVGISFNVRLLQVDDIGSRVTLWEDDRAHVSGKEVVERLSNLIRPSSRSLAFELLRCNLLAIRPQRPLRDRLAIWRDDRTQPKREAVVNVIIGMLYQNTARRYGPATVSFYRLSALSLEKVQSLNHYMATYLLASAVAEQGRREKSNSEAVELLLRSSQLFEKALGQLSSGAAGGSARALKEQNGVQLETLSGTGSNGGRQRSPISEGTPRDDSDHQRYKREDLKIRTALDTVWCLLVERSPKESEGAAVRAVRDLEADLTEAREIDTLLEEDPNATTCYALACAFAVAHRVEPLRHFGLDLARCLMEAKRWLVLAWLRDERWWVDGIDDPDLDSLREWAAEAHRRLQEERAVKGGDEPFNAARAHEIVHAVVDNRC